MLLFWLLAYWYLLWWVFGAFWLVGLGLCVGGIAAVWWTKEWCEYSLLIAIVIIVIIVIVIVIIVIITIIIIGLITFFAVIIW